MKQLFLILVIFGLIGSAHAHTVSREECSPEKVQQGCFTVTSPAIRNRTFCYCPQDSSNNDGAPKDAENNTSAKTESLDVILNLGNQKQVARCCRSSPMMPECPCDELKN